MGLLRSVYLMLAIVGGILNFIYILLPLASSGVIVGLQGGGLLALGSPNAVVAGLAFTVWVASETYVRKNWVALWSIAAIVPLGLGCALPLFLFLRSRPVI